MRTTAFEYTAASTLEEALERLTDGAAPLAGGQSLVQVMKLRTRSPKRLVDINRVPGLDEITVTDDEIKIGTLVRYATLVSSEPIRELLPSLAEAARRIADVQVRNQGTIGGNIAFADPRANLPPVLLSLRAQACVASRDESRAVDVAELFSGFRASALRNGELITHFVIPRPAPSAAASYRELSRQPNDLAMVNVAVMVDQQTATIAAGGLDVVPRRLKQLEAAWAGDTSPEAIREVVRRLDEEKLAPPPDPSHGPAEYRTRVGKIVLERAIRACCDRASNGRTGGHHG